MHRTDLSRWALAGFLIAFTTAVQAVPVVVGFERLESKTDEGTRGALLFNELGCANCHDTQVPLPSRKGPALGGLTQRVQRQWLETFLRSPEKQKAGTNMPAVFSNPTEQTIEALIQYLATIKETPRPKDAPQIKAAVHVNAERGKDIYHTAGCVACHAPAKGFVPAEGTVNRSEFSYSSVPLPELGEKYSLLSLARFLFDPLAVRPDGRMPKIAMQPQDAVDLAGYLLQFEGSDGRQASKIPEIPKNTDAAMAGKAIFEKARCGSCHESGESKKVAVRRTEAGCLGEQPADGLPRYSLNQAQRAALLSFLNGKTAAAQDEKTNTLLHLAALNCLACHEREATGGPDSGRKAYFQGDHNLGDTGRFPPPLTQVGRKLQREWLVGVLAGKNKVRSYLRTQMPVYADVSERLAHLLERTDLRNEPPLLGGEDSAGRKLLGTEGGMGCITCHRWGTRASLGIQALDLSNLGQRIRPEWLLEYLIAPAAYRPDTLMPSFWPSGVSSNRELLGGDTRRQVASIYSFAKSANGEPEGFPQTANGEYELIPKDAPIVQRTFMAEVGTHAILIGFPQGIHVAYDGKTGRPALAWKGRFFDAYTTWFSRFAPFEKPAGSSVVHWPKSESHEIEFLGFRYDAKRVPVFLFKVNGLSVEERFDAGQDILVRTISGQAVALENLSIQHPEGVEVRESMEGQQRVFRYLWK